MSAEPEVIEIPEDAYKQNDVVRPWPQPEPEEGRPVKRFRTAVAALVLAAQPALADRFIWFGGEK